MAHHRGGGVSRSQGRARHKVMAVGGTCLERRGPCGVASADALVGQPVGPAEKSSTRRRGLAETPCLDFVLVPGPYRGEGCA